MKPENILSEQLHEFCRRSINKIYTNETFHCSTTNGGTEIWHDNICDHMIGVQGSQPCCYFMNSTINQKRLKKEAPRVISNWQQRNNAMYVCKFTNTYFAFVQDNRHYFFLIPANLRDEMISFAKKTDSYVEFTKMVCVPQTDGRNTLFGN